MRVLDGDQWLLRIFLGESDRWHHTPLARAILGRSAEGVAGATIVHSVAGFGASSVTPPNLLQSLTAIRRPQAVEQVRRKREHDQARAARPTSQAARVLNKREAVKARGTAPKLSRAPSGRPSRPPGKAERP